ncbi:hypothetical protein WN944_001666 [Citrus x changshan-huyou]|uniref:ABC transporter domain-containing protein n=1 Tax=Citrus x changshan-huyou TaxID=2935761 RepID=A0AAP0MLC1_9ROSI
MLALLGPSGRGKTTLLTALGARLGQIQGSITYNGKPFSNTMNRHTGFIIEDDVLYPHSPVEETLVYTALLRLPNSLSKKDKIKKALLSYEGNSLYFGKASAAMDYFSNIGFSPSIIMNPSDFS